MNEQKNEMHKKLVDAFDDVDFQKQLNLYRYEIEIELKKFIDWLVVKLKPTQKIFHSPESRIKSKVSFEEKINRKDYINQWNVNDSEENLQDIILKNLPDLIGFRVTCYFMDDEQVIYDYLRTFHKDGNFSNIVLDFNEGTLQKNGKKIYKVSGKYQEKVSFELQIKAATHNVWGEVEHKTIYKGVQYSINHQQKQTITDEIFNILKSSDHQLLSLFKSSYTQDDLVCALFSEQTRNNIKDIAKTDYLESHYKTFFEIFFAGNKQCIYKYVSASLSSEDKGYVRPTPDLDCKEEIKPEIIAEIKSTFLEHYLFVQYCIAQEIYCFKNYDEFLVFMVKNAGRNIVTEDEEESVDDDVFAEDEIESKEEYGELVLKVLKDKLPNAVKERGENNG